MSKHLGKIIVDDIVLPCEEFYRIKLLYKDKVQVKHVKKS